MLRKTRYLSLILLLAFGFHGAVVSAQSTITPEMLRAYQNLTPAQRAQAMQVLQGGGGGLEIDADEDPELNESFDPSGFDLSVFENTVRTNPDVLRIQSADMIVVVTALKGDAESEDARRLMADINRSRIIGSHFFELDKHGVLELPGIASIPLAGLTAEEAAIRLGSEPMLAPLEITVTILPLEPVGTAALEPFGYSLFGEEPKPARRDSRALRKRNTFDANSLSNLPVPRDYVLGPGDSLRVQMYGNENESMTLKVQRDGTINFPRLGPRPVAGLTFEELRDEVKRWVETQLIGTNVSVSMGRLRSVKIFVVGDVKRPGGYTVSGLARMTNALFLAGGITRIGSLRKVQLRRDGKTIETLDLYDLLLRGDTRNDTQLRANDVVFIPPARSLIGIGGEVRRPAIYELQSERTVGELIVLAGGLLPTADATNVRLERVSSRGTRSVETLDVESKADLRMEVRSGDLVSVLPVLKEVGDAVSLMGHTTRPGQYEWSAGMRLTDLLSSEHMLKPKADLDYVLIRREVGPDRLTTVLSTDLGAALVDPASPANVELRVRDRVLIFELGVVRSMVISNILKELEAQATSSRPFQMVKIAGEVRSPGEYPLESDMRISDLLRAGGGLNSSAFSSGAELTRYVVDASGERRTELTGIDLDAIIAGDDTADPMLKPYDYLSIKETPAWEKQIEVELIGEVQFPGIYPVRRGETLRSVLERAGGLTNLAFPQGSVFTRQTLRKREADQLQILGRRLEADLAGLGLRAAADPSGNAQQAMSVGQSLLEQIRSTVPTGRLVIQLDKIVATDSDVHDIALRDGDALYVPHRSQEIMVLGEVQYTTSHLYSAGQNRDTYIGLSGGLTSNADSKRIYVVRANGAVQASTGSRWFRGGGQKVYPGDTIVVPMDTDRVPNIVQWASITQILYNLAISVAAVNSF